MEKGIGDFTSGTLVKFSKKASILPSCWGCTVHAIKAQWLGDVLQNEGDLALILKNLPIFLQLFANEALISCLMWRQKHYEKSTSIKWACLGLNAFTSHCQALKASNAGFKG
jgi:hypothetical protein